MELSQIGVHQLGRTLHFKLYVNNMDFDIEARIQAFTEEGPQIEIANEPNLFTPPETNPHDNHYSFDLPLNSNPNPNPNPDPNGNSIQVDSVNSLHFEGRAAVKKDVSVKDNYFVVPAGMQTSHLFKTVFYNYSNHAVKVSLDKLQPPFDCSYKNFIIKP